MFIDSHCHLERHTFGDQLDAVIERAFAAELSHMVAVGASRVAEGASEAIALAERLPKIYATAGIHPHDAAKATDADVSAIAAAARHVKVVSVGEIGLDYYYDFAPKDVQGSVFARQIAIAHDVDKPIMLHVRDAHEDAWKILDEAGVPKAGGIVHCFTAGPREADEYLKRGMHLSIPGVVTFPKSVELQEAVKMIPLERMLVETDTPYLAPVPFRGKRNEPAYVVHTASKIAELRGSTQQAIGEATRRNALAIFRIVA
ncbi:MAG: TatD family hydrolase [Myxococcota bacterium]|nr:TatD family hydrolase [Myxococcota bacterium]